MGPFVPRIKWSSSEKIGRAPLSASITPKRGKMARLAKTTVSVMEGSNAMKDPAVRLWKEEEGQDLTEYGLLLVLVALAAIATMQSLASALSNVFSNAATSLSTTT
jgi:pilus assembly protein Flp/PilA